MEIDILNINEPNHVVASLYNESPSVEFMRVKDFEKLIGALNLETGFYYVQGCFDNSANTKQEIYAVYGECARRMEKTDE